MTGCGNQTARILIQELSQPRKGGRRNEDQHSKELTVAALEQDRELDVLVVVRQTAMAQSTLGSSALAAHRVPRQDHRILCLDAEADPVDPIAFRRTSMPILSRGTGRGSTGGRKTVAIPQTQFIDRAANVPSVTQKVQKTVETLKVQVFDGIANVPVGWMDRCSRFRSASHRADPEG